ncbi:MAG: hypothetical protein L0228_04855, partial [Planctomycetes bacterium]|nr:hypothetical protein [Planctomycetota bacterium]
MCIITKSATMALMALISPVAKQKMHQCLGRGTDTFFPGTRVADSLLWPIAINLQHWPGQVHNIMGQGARHERRRLFDV